MLLNFIFLYVNLNFNTLAGMTETALETHYRTVADSSPIPVILYSVPANTGLDLPLQTVVNLASHPNIIGIKDSGGDITKLASMVHLTANQDFQVLAGSAGFLLPALTVGAVGGICALANVLPSQVCHLVTLFQEQNMQEARRLQVPKLKLHVVDKIMLIVLQHALISPNSAVTKQFGVAGLKQSMDWASYYGGPTRRPLLPLSADQTKKLKEAFLSSGFTFQH